MGRPVGPRYGPEHRRQARTLYIYQRLSLEVLSEKMGIAKSTLNNWKRQAFRDGDDWDQVRTTAELTDAGFKYTIANVMESYLRQNKQALADLEADKTLKAADRAKIMSSLAFSLREMRQSVSQLNPEMNKLALAMEVIHRLATFVRDQFPQHTEAMLEILEPFGEAMSKRYG